MKRNILMAFVMFWASFSYGNTLEKMAFMVQPDSSGLTAGIVTVQAVEDAADPTFKKQVSKKLTLSSDQLAVVQTAYATIMAALKAADSLQ